MSSVPPDPGKSVRIGRHEWRLLPGEALVMGIVNVTPDSFSDGGVHLDPSVAVAAALAMLDAGADLVDVGGESTRPGATEVDESDEIRRVLPVIVGIRRARPDAPISLDTRRAAVAREVLAAASVDLLNDVSGLASGPDLARVAAAAGSGLVLGHLRGTPATMQEDPRFDDVVGEVAADLSRSTDAAVAAGVPRDRVLVDPGIGFGKTLAHNLALLRALDRLVPLAGGVVVGTSRKRFLGELTGRTVPRERMAASVGSALEAASRGASVVRVHDVPETVDAFRVRRALLGG